MCNVPVIRCDEQVISRLCPLCYNTSVEEICNDRFLINLPNILKYIPIRIHVIRCNNCKKEWLEVYGASKDILADDTIKRSFNHLKFYRNAEEYNNSL